MFFTTIPGAVQQAYSDIDSIINFVDSPFLYQNVIAGSPPNHDRRLQKDWDGSVSIHTIRHRTTPGGLSPYLPHHPVHQREDSTTTTHKNTKDYYEWEFHHPLHDHPNNDRLLPYGRSDQTPPVGFQ
jgi:hypothetical protein